MKPRIAMTASLGPVSGGLRVHVPIAYVDAVEAAGGRPIILPPIAGEASAEELLSVADGLLLAGGDDLDPALWGETPHPAASIMDPRRQKADLAWIALAEACGLPVLGICLGCQQVAAHRGGRLIQHVPDEPGAVTDHGCGGRRTMHRVAVEPGSLLARVVGAEPLEVNSSHHQAVREAGRGMRVVARAEDGVIEGIEDPAPGRFFLGVQWHPELLIDRPRHLALFEALCRAAAESSAR